MMTPSSVDITRFAAMVKAKRANRPLRVVAAEVGGVTASTLSRIERENAPDLESFMRLCGWLGVSADAFRPPALSETVTALSMPDKIEANLRADRILPTDAVEALSQMIRFAYKAVSEGKLRSKEG